LGRHGAILARRYSWERITEQMMTLYESVIAGIQQTNSAANHVH
jgi:hypothetical protein